MEDFMKHFKDKSEAERDWLKELFECVSGQQLCAEERVCDACVCLVTRIQETIGAHAHTLPLSYRLLPVSELVARQHVPCVSNLSWGTNQHRAWVREAESLTLANCKALSRVNLLLIGCLREGQGREWRLTDGSGAVRCECVSFSPLWLNRAFLLPHWNYIPHNAPQHNQEEAGGYLELIGSPLPLLSDREGGLAVQPRGVELSGAMGVREATECLSNRQRGLRLHVKGTVRSLLPLLVICGNSFFILRLTDDTNTHTLSVLVTESSCLWWRDCLSVDQSVCVSALRVCALRSWKGNRILCTTDRSALHILSPDAHVHTQHTHAHNTHNTYVEDSLSLVELGLDQCDTGTHTDAQTDTQMDTDTDTQDAPAMPNIVDASEEAGPESVQAAVRVKQSKVISYQGVVTEVVNEGAGLYVIDGKVGLCLAFQPTLRRSLRQGDTIELYDVHFLYRPCPDSSPSMLCACLRTSLKVTTFSRSTGSGVTGNRDDGALPRLLLEKNLTVAQYLWLSHVINQLRDSLVPTLVREGRVCVMSHCLLECVWSGEREKRRDIYEEMLNEPHSCLLSQYCVYGSVCECVSVRRCVSLFQSEGVSLVPPAGASSLCQTELNAALSWSHRTAQGNRRQRPLVLVGVLDLPTRAHCSEEHTQPRTQHTPTDSPQHTPSRTHWSHHTLCLRDQTGAVACVVTETSHDDDDDDEGVQRAVFNTAWIGSLVCVQKFTVVTEQFLQSDFPSVRHLKNNKYIKHTHYRVYLQFSLDDVHILSPSVAMATHLLHAGERRSRGGEKRRREEHKEPGGKRRKMEAGGGQKEEQVKDKNPGEEEGMTTASAQPTPATPSAQLPGRTASAQPTPTTATPSAQLPGRTASAQATPTTATPSAQLPGRTASAQPTATTATPSAQLPGNNRPCPSVSVVIRMDEKEGVAWKNAVVGSGAEGAGLCLGFSVGAAAIGPTVGWGWNPRNEPMTERESAREKNRKVVLVFSGQCVRWFPVLQPDCCYRLVVTDTQDSSVLIGSSVVERRGVELHTSPSLLVRSDWKFYSLTRPLLMSPYHQLRPSRVMSVSDILDCSPVDVVCFQGFVSQRNSLYDNKTRNTGLTETHTEGLSVRLTLCDQSGRSLQVYLDLSHTPYPPGLLPGNTLLLSGFQRKVSRTGNVYCKSLPVSSVTVISLGDISSPQAPPSPPTMHLGHWGLQCGENRGIVGTVRGHVVCVLSLQLQWACSVCASVYTKSCSRSQCFSNSSVFKGQAKCVVEDGTGEGQVWFASEQLQRLLGLVDSQWEGLQRALRVRGLLRIYTSGRGLVCDTDGTDPVLQYVVCLCSSNAVCRLVSLTCKTNTHSRTSEETLKRFSRGERDFMTRMNPPLQLTCISILTE